MILKAITYCSKHPRSKIFLSSSFLPLAAFAGKNVFLFIENKKLNVKSMYVLEEAHAFLLSSYLVLLPLSPFILHRQAAQRE